MTVAPHGCGGHSSGRSPSGAGSANPSRTAFAMHVPGHSFGRAGFFVAVARGCHPDDEVRAKGDFVRLASPSDTGS
jgi:hypothetical protein